MKNKEMSVRLLAKPEIDWQQMHEWVAEQNGNQWYDRIINENAKDGELLIESAGRMCYRSFGTEYNPNVSKVRTDSHAYLQNLHKVGHGSVLEHANYSFSIEGVSRVVTHELARHRHEAISQESQRYVRTTDILFRVPDWVADDVVLSALSDEIISHIELFAKVATKKYDLDNPDVDFHTKKEITSDIRRYLPEGTLTGLVWTANVRSLRHIIQLRTAEGAEREIRELFHKIALIMQEECPYLFSDLEPVDVAGSSTPKWVSQYNV